MDIKTMDLSFCGANCQNIVNKEAKEFIINKLKESYNISIKDNRAYILNNKSVLFLERTQHIISIKSSGTNYYLYFTKINNINYCFFIDRKIKNGYTLPRIISTKYRFDDEIFQDTLIDGELIKNESDHNQWMFLISDMLLYKGKKLETNIINRFNLLYKMLANEYIIDETMDICPLVVKKMFRYNEYDKLITQFIPSLPYKTKGLYFNSLNVKHGNQLFIFDNNVSNKNRNYNIQQTYNKYKDNKYKDNTDILKATNNSELNVNTIKRENDVVNKSDIIFKIKSTNTSDIYDLYCNNNHTIEKYGVACIPNMRTSKMVRQFINSSDSVYVNCIYNNKFNKYQPLSQATINTDSDIVDISNLSNKL
jgi:hypothetical protein